MRLMKSKPVDALGQPLDAVELYKPVQPFMAPLDGAPMVYQLATRLPGNHPGVLQTPLMWIKSSVDSETAAQLRNAAIFGQPAPAHAPFTREPQAIPTSRRMRVTRSFIAGAGSNIIRLNEGDIVDGGSDYFRDLVKAFPDNFRRDTATEEAA